jgi:hypothetical protein
MLWSPMDFWHNNLTELETDPFTIDRRVSIAGTNEAGLPVSASTVIGGITFDPHVCFDCLVEFFRLMSSKISLFFLTLDRLMVELDQRERLQFKLFSIHRSISIQRNKIQLFKRGPNRSYRISCV